EGPVRRSASGRSRCRLSSLLNAFVPQPIRWQSRAGNARAGMPVDLSLKETDMPEIGRRRWAIAEGYIPGESSFDDPALVSHETACILNAGDRDAQVEITLYFGDREPVGPY